MEMNKLVIDRLYEMQKEGHPHAVPVFGGAAFAFNCVNCDNPDFDMFIIYLKGSLKNCKFWGYNNFDEVIDIFCNLCLVDPILVRILL